MAIFSQEAAYDRDEVIALLEDVTAGNKARPPLVEFRAVLAPVRGDVFLGNTVNDRANPGPHAGARAHGARLMRGVEDKVGQIAAITAGYVFKSFQLDMLDAGSRSFYPVARVGNDNLAFARNAGNDRADGIISPVAGALGLRDRQLHKLLFRLV